MCEWWALILRFRKVYLWSLHACDFGGSLFQLEFFESLTSVWSIFWSKLSSWNIEMPLGRSVPYTNWSTLGKTKIWTSSWVHHTHFHLWSLVSLQSPKNLPEFISKALSEALLANWQRNLDPQPFPTPNSYQNTDQSDAYKHLPHSSSTYSPEYFWSASQRVASTWTANCRAQSSLQ